MMGRFHCKIFIVRPVLAVRPSSSSYSAYPYSSVCDLSHLSVLCVLRVYTQIEGTYSLTSE